MRFWTTLAYVIGFICYAIGGVLIIGGLIGLLTASGVRSAETPRMERGIVMPPPQYDHEPTVRYRVKLIDQATINKLCWRDLQAARVFKPDARIAGCTNLKTLDVYISKGFSPETRVFILRHEKGHVNGWRH